MVITVEALISGHPRGNGKWTLNSRMKIPEPFKKSHNSSQENLVMSSQLQQVSKPMLRQKGKQHNNGNIRSKQGTFKKAFLKTALSLWNIEHLKSKLNHLILQQTVRVPGIHEMISKNDYKNAFECFYELSPSISDDKKANSIITAISVVSKVLLLKESLPENGSFAVEHLLSSL